MRAGAEESVPAPEDRPSQLRRVVASTQGERDPHGVRQDREKALPRASDCAWPRPLLTRHGPSASAHSEGAAGTALLPHRGARSGGTARERGHGGTSSRRHTVCGAGLVDSARTRQRSARPSGRALPSLLSLERRTDGREPGRGLGGTPPARSLIVDLQPPEPGGHKPPLFTPHPHGRNEVSHRPYLCRRRAPKCGFGGWQSAGRPQVRRDQGFEFPGKGRESRRGAPSLSSGRTRKRAPRGARCPAWLQGGGPRSGEIRGAGQSSSFGSHDVGPSVSRAELGLRTPSPTGWSPTCRVGSLRVDLTDSPALDARVCVRPDSLSARGWPTALRVCRDVGASRTSMSYVPPS